MVKQSLPPVFIITGKRRGGKTSFLVKVIELILEEGLNVDGILALSSSGEEYPDSYTLQHIRSNQTELLCKRDPADGWNKFGPFYFNPAAILSGYRQLTRPATLNNDLLVIDEIGKFELEGKIWAKSFTWLLRNASCALLLSVRDTFTEQVIEKWNMQATEIFNIKDSDPARVCQSIIQRIKINKP